MSDRQFTFKSTYMSLGRQLTDLICPRCQNQTFLGYECCEGVDIRYTTLFTSYRCCKCGLFFDGDSLQWYDNVKHPRKLDREKEIYVAGYG